MASAEPVRKKKTCWVEESNALSYCNWSATIDHEVHFAKHWVLKFWRNYEAKSCKRAKTKKVSAAGASCMSVIAPGAKTRVNTCQMCMCELEPGKAKLGLGLMIFSLLDGKNR